MVWIMIHSRRDDCWELTLCCQLETDKKAVTALGNSGDSVPRDTDFSGVICERERGNWKS